MLFNTVDFVLFLPLIVILYYAIPHKFRWTLLLAGSYYFYMCWKVNYIFLIIASTLIDYFSGLKMEQQANQRKKLPFLILSLVSNLGLLFTFKYFNFFAESSNFVLQKFNISTHLPILKLLLPVGISFYTFQTLSYSIDVFFGRQKAERHLGYFALYVSFFPQLVAGPIERFSRLTPQLKARHVLSYENVSKGLRLILYGLFIKMVIADNLSGVVDSVYQSPQKYASKDILTAIFFYSFQIYCDFFGYSLIAIGSARLMGIKLMDNFKTPYLSKNIAEFWQRWHISLSTWFRDYLYLPLGGNRVSKIRWIINIAIVFIVSGIWHGANWTFLIWGALYGILYIGEKLINDNFGINSECKPFSFKHIGLSIKTYVLVAFIWVFFRSQSFSEAISIFKSILKNTAVESPEFSIPTVTWVALLLFIISDTILYNTRFDSWIDKFSFPIRWAIYSLLLFFIIAFAGVDTFQFIYFQF